MNALYRMLDVLGSVPGLGALRDVSAKFQRTSGGITSRITDVKYKAAEFNDVRKAAGEIGGKAGIKKKTKKGAADAADPSESGGDDPTVPGGGSGAYGASGGAAGGDSSSAPKAIPGVHVSRRKNLREERERDREMRRRRS